MMYILKNIGKMPNQPEWLQKESYTRLFDACEIAGFTEDKLIKYESDMYDERRLEGERSAYRRLGQEEGRAEGQAELIRNMMQSGMTVEEISAVVKISVHEIKKLISDE